MRSGAAGRRRARLSGALAATVIVAACGAPPPASHEEGATGSPASRGAPADEAAAHAGHDPAAEGTGLPLRLIMQGLAADMARVADGVWTGDGGAVFAAALRVAEHPRVTPAQMGIIQALLGSEFSVFVAHDGRVHDAAVALSRAADSGASPEELLEGFVEVQRGCVACHARFQSRVSSALAAADAGESR